MLVNGNAMEHGWVGPEHLLVALFDSGDSMAARAMIENGVDRQRLRDQVERTGIEDGPVFLMDASVRRGKGIE